MRVERDRRTSGLLLAGLTACVSGVAVFVNGYGVRATSDATLYTTAKNLVAALVVGAVAVAASRRHHADAPRLPHAGDAWALAAIAVVGGSVPFVLFFEGLARASSSDAAFLHKTLVLWVALLAPTVLRERVSGWHVAAVGLLVAGQAVLAGGPSDIGRGSGEALLLGATALWAVEVVVAKRVLARTPSLTVGLARMGGGAIALVAWCAVTGRLGEVGDIDGTGWWWIVVAGLLLGAYVTTWFAALARAGALDVTAVLVPAALVTAVLATGIRSTPWVPNAGVALLVAGLVLTVLAARRRPVATTGTT